MKILYIHQHFSTISGSAGTRSYEMALRLVASGHHVTIVCGSAATAQTGLSGEFSKGVRRGNVDGIDVVEFDIPYSNYYNFSHRLVKFLQFAIRATVLVLREKFDLLFATSTPLTVAIPGIVGAMVYSRPFVFEVRDLVTDAAREMKAVNKLVVSAMKLLECVTCRFADSFIALSPGIAESIHRHGVPKSRIELIPNGCDLKLFKKNTAEAWRPSKVPSDNLQCIYAGAHGFTNGLDAVLDAAELLILRKRTDISIIFVGDGVKKPSLFNRVMEAKLTNCIFLDPVSKLELVGLFASSDIGLMILSNIPTFYNSTSPNKFFDYISAELPILTNYPGWIADIITDNQCGVVIPPDDPVAFADALEQIADNRLVLKKMGKAGVTLAQREFDRDKLADRLVGFLEQVERKAQ